MANDFDCIVIGGGAAGLGTAWNLLQRGARVLVLEAGPDLGGLVSSYQFENYRIEKFYHHFFPSDDVLFETAERVGVADDIQFRPASVGHLTDGNVYHMDTPFQLLRFPGLSLVDKFRLWKLMRTCRTLSNGQIRQLDAIPAEAWIRRVASDTVFERFFEPLMQGKFGEEADDISAAWLVSRVKLRSDRSFWKGETLCYMKGGYQTLLEALAEEISTKGEIHVSEPAVEIIVEGNRAVGVRTDKDEYRSDAVVAALTPGILCRLVEFPPQYESRLQQIDFQACTCVMLGVKESVIPVYWLNIDSAELPFDVMLEHNHLFDDPAYDCRLIYLASYFARPSDPLFRMAPDDILDAYLDGLEAVFDWESSDVLWWRCAKGPAAGPIYRMGYLDIKPSHTTPIEALWHASMAHSFPERSVADSLKQGKTVSDQVVEWLS